MEFYTTKEVAEMLKVTKKTINQYVREGKIKAIDMGNQYRFTKEQIEDFVENNIVDNSGGK